MSKGISGATKQAKVKKEEFESLPAIEISQQGHTMYAFVASSHLLRRICTVSRRAEDDDKGYQRHLKETRLRQLARYVDDDKGVIPNNIIVNFFDNAVVYSGGKLRVPRSRVAAWVIDGQHRLFGFEYAKKQYDLLVVGFIGLDVKEQVDIFSTINTEQKKLPTSLALDLLKFTGDPEKDLQTRCRELIARLQEEPESPWFQSINMTGEGTGLISLVNFVRKLKPILDTGGVLNSYPFEEQYGAVANYWRAIRAVYSEQWNTKGSLLTKTVGFGALMNVFPTVFSKTLALHGKLRVADIVEVLKLIGDFQFNSDNLGSGAGNKAETEAAKSIDQELTKAIAGVASAGILKL